MAQNKKSTKQYPPRNVINYPKIDYITKSYVPELQITENRPKYVNMELFEEAMIHDSMKNTYNKTYERLEYLGDAIFHMVITDYLFRRYSDETEGFLTRIRIRIERGDSMAELTKCLDLVPYIQIIGAEVNEHILEDVFEAFIGAFYLVYGFKYVRLLIIRLIERHKNLSELIHYDDNYKDLLLRYFHQMKWSFPVYHNNKNPKSKSEDDLIVSKVYDPDNKLVGKGYGQTKRKAEQNASQSALIKFKVIINGEIDLNWLEKFEDKRTSVQDEMIDSNEKKGKKPLSVYNEKNILVSKSIVKEILAKYNTHLAKSTTFNIKPFQEAMTHSSYLRRKKLTDNDKIQAKTSVKLQKTSNDRLRFLGDPIIHFIIGDMLFHKYPDANEGFLTRLRSKLENRNTLRGLAIRTGLTKYLLISQGVEIMNGRNNTNLNARGFQSFIGSIYYELGIVAAQQFLTEVIRIELNIQKIAESEKNYKDLILHYYNQNNLGRPIYKIIREEGPDHCKEFTMGIYLGRKLMGVGKASSKKKAEQIASKMMYKSILEEGLITGSK